MDEFPEGFDLEALLAPVPGAAPAGVDLRGDSSPQSRYFRLRDARAEARAAERAMEADDAATAPPPQWRTVRDLGIEVIIGYSKDLEIAAWVTEALLRGDGLVTLERARLLTEAINAGRAAAPAPRQQAIKSLMTLRSLPLLDAATEVT